MFRNTLRLFAADQSGNFLVTLSMLMVPIVVVTGLAVDYGRAGTQRANMQNALDAAAFAAFELPVTASKDERQAVLAASYLANGGEGEPSIVGDLDIADGNAALNVAARAKMPRTFMRVASTSDVDIHVRSSVAKRQTLDEAIFRMKQVTGIWDKKVTLFGRERGQTDFQELLIIDYQYNGLGETGVGDIFVSKPSAGEANPQRWVDCSGVRNDPTSCNYSNIDGKNQVTIDVSKIEEAYLQMDISARTATAKKWLDHYAPPTTIRSNDPKLADRLFIDEVKQKPGSPVDILRSVKCGEWGSQDWEDGGGTKGMRPVEGTDFRYEVMGKCGWSSGNGVVRLTR